MPSIVPTLGSEPWCHRRLPHRETSSDYIPPAKWSGENITPVSHLRNAPSWSPDHQKGLPEILCLRVDYTSVGLFNSPLEWKSTLMVILQDLRVPKYSLFRMLVDARIWFVKETWRLSVQCQKCAFRRLWISPGIQILCGQIAQSRTATRCRNSNPRAGAESSIYSV